MTSEPATTEVPQAGRNEIGDESIDIADGRKPDEEVVGAPATSAWRLENEASNGDGSSVELAVTSQPLFGGAPSIAADDSADHSYTAKTVGIEHSKESTAAVTPREPADGPRVTPAVENNISEEEQGTTVGNEVLQPQTAASSNGTVEPGVNGEPSPHDEVCTTGVGIWWRQGEVNNLSTLNPPRSIPLYPLFLP